MPTHRHRLAFLAVAGMALATPALASDCQDPSTPVSRAVCATPGGRRADDAMGAALGRTGRADLMSPARRDLFIADQGAWLARRELTAGSITPAAAEAGLRRRADQLSACYPEPDQTMATRLGVLCVAYVAPKCPGVYLEADPRVLHVPAIMAPSLAMLAIDAGKAACQRMNVPVSGKPRHSFSMDVTGERRGVVFTRIVETRGSFTSVSADAWDATTGAAIPWDAVLPGLVPGTPAWAGLFSASGGKGEDVDGNMRDLRPLGIDLASPPQGWHVSSGGDLVFDFARPFPGGQDYVSVEVPRPLFIRHVAPAWLRAFAPRA